MPTLLQGYRAFCERMNAEAAARPRSRAALEADNGMDEAPSAATVVPKTPSDAELAAITSNAGRRKSGASAKAKTLSRREMFAGGGLLGALAGHGIAEWWGAAKAAAGTATSGPGPAVSPELDPFAPPADPTIGTPNYSRLRKLVDRTTFGPSPYELPLAERLGYRGYLEFQLNHTRIDDSACDALLAPYSARLESTQQVWNRLYESGTFDYTPLSHMLAATVLRGAYSRRQLYERMVEFWSDHFSINLQMDGQYLFKVLDDREVVRKHALGTFPDLLLASMTSPAMLFYLNNDTSYVGSPNQNYARELLELHTLSPGAPGAPNYTQRDIEEVARALTGWRIHTWGVGDWAQRGDFFFDADAHDNGPKQILGYDLPAGGGINDGYMVHWILTQSPTHAPITARFLATKLARYFWGNATPPTGLVQGIVDAYLRNRGDIRAMVRAALSERFLDAAPLKLKRPFHYLMSILRGGAGSTINNMDTVLWWLDLMAHHPFHWAPPNGYPDAPGYWSNGLLQRWSIGAYAVEWDTLTLPLNDIIAAPNPTAAVKIINNRWFNGRLTTTEVNALIGFLNQAGPSVDWFRREAAGLAFGAPSFQWY